MSPGDAAPYPAYRILSQAYTSQTRQALRRCAIYRRRTRHYAGWRLRLTRPTYLRPAVNLFTIVAETADAGGLKIAETFPEGRGSPHGCGLRAVFCRDAASARPDACRDKSKAPRSGDFAGRSPGVQGAAATGRPLCAPCAIRDITQKINRERNLPGINIEVVALPNIVRTVTFPVVPLFRRVAATPYPAYRILSQAYTSQARQAQRRCAIYRRRTRHYAGWRLRLTRPTGSSRKLTPRRPGKRCAAGQSIGVIPAIMPGGDYALPGLQQLPGNPTRTTT
ncbi:Uncharacterised protein [Klebsiella quasipneumoniae]|nr:Uncharacterised protein [Klebsiella quasipneumoniae]VFZ98953.1 Uncharacterised protein [Klebsiella quasipneumoniae]